MDEIDFQHAVLNSQKLQFKQFKMTIYTKKNHSIFHPKLTYFMHVKQQYISQHSHNNQGHVCHDTQYCALIHMVYNI